MKHTQARRAFWASCIFLIGIPSVLKAQKASLTPDDIKTAIEKGTAQKNTFYKELGIGLRLSDGLLAYQLQVYTPTTWIQRQALNAAFKYEPYTPSDDDLRPVLRVIVTPRAPEGMYSCPLVNRVILQDTKKTNTAQPLTAVGSATVYQNAFGAQTICTRQYSEFALADLAQLRGSSDDGFVIKILQNQSGSEMSYEVKKKHFERIP